MNLEALYAYVTSTPLVWIIVTISAYKIGILVYEKTGKNALLQPIVVAYMIMLPILLVAKIPYQQYFESVSIIHFILGPATVALALLPIATALLAVVSVAAFAEPITTVSDNSDKVLFVPNTIVLSTFVAVLLKPVTELYWLMLLLVPVTVLLTPIIEVF